MEFEMIAKTFMGLEDILAQELTELGANNVQKGCRVVTFTGDKALMYRANFALRTAVRVLKPIKHFTVASADEVYDAVKNIEWGEYIDEGKTFTVDSVVYSETFSNSRFVTYKVKDAIVDYFREKTGKRPSISITDPDIRLNIHISGTEGTLSLDSSGESLHRRGYRQETVEAPLNEVLAAGMIMMTGWKGETDFIDPMCGSGTLPIEAALIARNIAPGVFRKEYAFEKWADFDADLFDEIYNDDSKERDFDHHVYGYDIDMKAVNMATMNVKAAGLTSDITISQQDFKEFAGHEEKAIIVTNPPYGERISTPNLMETYKMIGERLKHAFKEGDAWILSYKEECFQQIGLKPSVKIPLYNGSLECEFRKYTLFDGKFKEFREEGGIVKTDADKQKMAEKRRTWKRQEYDKHVAERIDNEEADILSFRFTSLEKQRNAKKNSDRIARKGYRGENNEERGDGKRGERKPFRGGKFRKNGERETRADRQKVRKQMFGRRTDDDAED